MIDEAKVQAEVEKLLEWGKGLRAYYEADWDPNDEVNGVPVPGLREYRLMYSTREQLREWVIEVQSSEPQLQSEPSPEEKPSII